MEECKKMCNKLGYYLRWWFIHSCKKEKKTVQICGHLFNLKPLNLQTSPDICNIGTENVILSGQLPQREANIIRRNVLLPALKYNQSYPYQCGMGHIPVPMWPGAHTRTNVAWGTYPYQCGLGHIPVPMWPGGTYT